MLLYKILEVGLLENAKKEGLFKGAEIDLKDGYIHFSTADTVVETCRLHFRGRTSLALFAVESEDFGPELKWEQSRGGKSFPHLYSTLSIDKILWSTFIRLDENDTHVFPDLKTGSLIAVC